MKAIVEQFTINTTGKGTYEITEHARKTVAKSGVETGTITLFIRHTSASLLIFENADPSARMDLESFFDRLVPEEASYFVHTLEGSDDMPSHIRMALTRSSETIPIMNGKMGLGTWQGIFLFEHRTAPHRREILASVVGV